MPNAKRVLTASALALMLLVGLVAITSGNGGTSGSAQLNTPVVSSTLSARGLPAIKVAALSGWDAFAWSSSCAASDMDASAPSSYNTSACTAKNVAAIESSIAQAASEGAQMIVLPEGYDYTIFPTPTTLEPLMATVGYSACNDSVKEVAPQQYMMSCAAAKYNIAVAGNSFVTLTADTGADPDCTSDTCNNRIQEIVYDQSGAVVALYSKYHTFPSDLAFASPGHKFTVTFELLGHKFGILVCYDGLYPFIFNNYTQFDAYQAEGVDTILWSGGGPDPFFIFGPKLAAGWDVNVVASTVREGNGGASASLMEGPGLSGNIYAAKSGDIPLDEQHTDLPLPADYTYPVQIVHATIA